MKNQYVIAIIAALVSVLGIQTYWIYQLNNEVNQLTHLSQPSLAQTGKKPSVTLPKPNFNQPFFDDNNWSPYEEMQRMQNDMEQMFNDSFSRFHQNPSFRFNKMPELDLKDQENEYVITVNAPGADKSSLEIKLEGRQVHISMKTQGEQETDTDKSQYRRKERFVGTFHRILTLPDAANGEKMTTDYTNGVLTIKIPKH